MDVTSLVGSSWNSILHDEFDKDYIKSLMQFITEQRKKDIVYPSRNEVFTAFKLTPYNQVKVILLGEEPYHKEGLSHGLAYSCKEELEIYPATLRNILIEIENDYECFLYDTHDLSYLAKQGVLLLNRILTVTNGLPLSHKDRGWERLIIKVVQLLNKKNNLVFLLWGENNWFLESYIDQTRHLILKTSSPSPAYIEQGFKGNGHFWKTNDYLLSNNIEAIQWIP